MKEEEGVEGEEEVNYLYGPSKNFEQMLM